MLQELMSYCGRSKHPLSGVPIDRGNPPVEFDIPVDGFEFCGVVVALVGGGFELPIGFFEFGSG